MTQRSRGFGVPPWERGYGEQGPAEAYDDWWGQQVEYYRENGYNRYGEQQPVAWPAEYGMAYYDEPPRAYPGHRGGQAAHYGGPPPPRHTENNHPSAEASASVMADNTGTSVEPKGEEDQAVMDVEEVEEVDNKTKKKRRRRRKNKKDNNTPEEQQQDATETPPEARDMEEDNKVKKKRRGRKKAKANNTPEEEKQDDTEAPPAAATTDKQENVNVEDAVPPQTDQEATKEQDKEETTTATASDGKKKKRHHSKRKVNWTIGNVLNTMLGRNGYAHDSSNFNVETEPEDFTEDERHAMAHKWHRELAYLELGKRDGVHAATDTDNAGPITIDVNKIWDDKRTQQLRRDLEYFGGRTRSEC